MPKFSVMVTRDTTESVCIEVEAPDAETAEEMALGQSYTGGFIWEQDDTPNVSAEHYTTSCDPIG